MKKNGKGNKSLFYWGLSVLLFVLGYTLVILQNAPESSSQAVESNSEVISESTLEAFEFAKKNASALRENRLTEDVLEDNIEDESETESSADEKKAEDNKLTKDEVIKMAADGSLGNTSERKKKISELGFDYDEIQNEVNKILENKKADSADKVEQAEKVKDSEKVDVAKSDTSNNNKTITELAKEVHAGKWGSGSQRAKNLTNAGYDAKAVQAEVNKKSANAEGSSTSSSSGGSSQQSKYKANRVYVGGTEMGMKTTSFDNLQSVIDNTTYTWIGFETFNPHDNKGTYLAQHRHTGGGVVLNQEVGNSVIVTDSNGAPHYYKVTKVLKNQEYFTDELLGRLNKEYIVLQTSEHRINGNRVGNRMVIADKN